MRISLKSEYALRTVFDLAMQEPDARVTAAGIADRQNISRQLLVLILAKLKDGGFVSARRGSEGGYCLTKPPDQITVGDVLALVAEIEQRKQRTHGPFSELWSRTDASTFSIVDRTTFAELAEVWKSRRKHHVANGRSDAVYG